jgi:SAM-dependent methyltransferase
MVLPVSKRSVQTHYQQARAELFEHNPRCIAEAPDRIARSVGLRDYDEMAGRHHALKLLSFQAMADLPGDELTERDNRKILARSPYNYLRHHWEYLDIEVPIRLLFGEDRGMRGLQLGSNFGPYLHYLKEKRNCPNFLGVDIDPVAVGYARSIGVPVVKASVTELPFAPGSFDLVFSQNLLVHDYERCLEPVRPRDRSRVAALGEIFLVLRPGGRYISSLEDWSDQQIGGSGFRPHPAFQGDWFDEAEAPELKDLQVFEKV